MKFVNPYNDVIFGTTPRVMSNSHEHIFNDSQFRQAWLQGIRIFACVNYSPSAPSVSTKTLNSDNEQCTFANWKIPVKDWINTDVPDNYLQLSENEREQYMTVRYYEGGYESISWPNPTPTTIYPKFIPQIANSEHANHKWTNDVNSDYEVTHHNVLGSLVTEPTNGFNNTIPTNELYPGFDVSGNLDTIAKERSWRARHALYSMVELTEKYINTDKQQFNGKIFGTVNHSHAEEVEEYFNLYPQIFKALELFNQYYSPLKNERYRERYDFLLREGYRIFGVAATDWIDTIETYSGLEPEEQAEWTARWNALTAEEKAQYSNSITTYYNATVVREARFNRGANMLYIDDYNEANIDTLEKAMVVAEKGLDSYIAGRYYMTGTGVNYIESLSVSASQEMISIRVSGNPSNIRAITSKRVIESTGNTLSVLIERGETYIRFEAYYHNHPEGWDSMTSAEQKEYISQGVEDFLFTNPIWIEDNENPISQENVANRMLALDMI